MKYFYWLQTWSTSTKHEVLLLQSRPSGSSTSHNKTFRLWRVYKSKTLQTKSLNIFMNRWNQQSAARSVPQLSENRFSCWGLGPGGSGLIHKLVVLNTSCPTGRLLMWVCLSCSHFIYSLLKLDYSLCDVQPRTWIYQPGCVRAGLRSVLSPTCWNSCGGAALWGGGRQHDGGSTAHPSGSSVGAVFTCSDWSATRGSQIHQRSQIHERRNMLLIWTCHMLQRH